MITNQHPHLRKGKGKEEKERDSSKAWGNVPKIEEESGFASCRLGLSEQFISFFF